MHQCCPLISRRSAQKRHVRPTLNFSNCYVMAPVHSLYFIHTVYTGCRHRRLKSCMTQLILLIITYRHTVLAPLRLH